MLVNQFSESAANSDRTMTIRVDGPSLVVCARRAVHDALRTWDLSEFADTVVLVASELVTNALCHGETAEIPLLLTARGGNVVLEVSDDSDVEPSAGTAGTDAESGRGLFLVGALADAWGSKLLEGGGKSVWASFAMSTDTTERVSTIAEAAPAHVTRVRG